MIAVVDSGVANLESVMAALRRLNADARLTSDPTEIRVADKVIIPGVGSAQAGMRQLQAKKLVSVLKSLAHPVLGICLGMQMMFDRSREDGETQCLGILPGTIELLPSTTECPVPHMGWNQIAIKNSNHPLLKGIAENSYVYFVHSYAAPVSDMTVAATDYGQSFSSVVARGNFMGCQFHPERSGTVGQNILKNFLSL